MRSGRPTAAEAAAQLLRASGNPAIQWGDSALLHAVAKSLGLDAEGAKTEARVLDKIERTHAGVLVKSYVSHPVRGAGRVRKYSLPESVQASM